MSEHEFKYELGLKAQDKISGFKGTITARVEYLTGCDRYSISPKLDSRGRPIESQSYDEGRIEILKDEKKIKPEDVQGKKNGADNNPDDPHGKGNL